MLSLATRICDFLVLFCSGSFRLRDALEMALDDCLLLHQGLLADIVQLCKHLGNPTHLIPSNLPR